MTETRAVPATTPAAATTPAPATGPATAAPTPAPHGPGDAATGPAPPARVRVVLPAHLRALARVQGEVGLAVAGPVTTAAVLDALEAELPVLRGRIRDTVTARRRAFVRYYACSEDLSHEPPDSPLPAAVAAGQEPFLVVGAMAGG